MDNLLFHAAIKVVANCYGVSKQLVDVPGRRIHWAGGRNGPPPDTPPCGFDNTKCPDNSKSSSGLKPIELYNPSTSIVQFSGHFDSGWNWFIKSIVI